jgi:hypothetical protein
MRRARFLNFEAHVGVLIESLASLAPSQSVPAAGLGREISSAIQ